MGFEFPTNWSQIKHKVRMKKRIEHSLHNNFSETEYSVHICISISAIQDSYSMIYTKQLSANEICQYYYIMENKINFSLISTFFYAENGQYLFDQLSIITNVKIII